MTWFVLAYDRRLRAVVERFDFAEAEHDVAWDKRERLIRKYLRDPEIEVVLLGSRDEQSLRATHGRYFMSEHAA